MFPWKLQKNSQSLDFLSGSVFSFYLVPKPSFFLFLHLLQGHKRAPSDVSVASSEDEKIPLSPSILESVPEKLEQILPVPAQPELPETNHVENISEQAAPEEQTEENSDARVKEDEEKPAVKEEEEPPEAEHAVASPEPEPSAEPPNKELQQLQIDVDDEKEVDTAEAPECVEASEIPYEENTPATSPAEEEEDKEEERYKQPKVTLTLPEKDNTEMKEETSKEEKEVQNIDSRSGSAADGSSVDLNLSISSFLSKTKEPGSVAMQVSPLSQNPPRKNNFSLNVDVFPGCQEKENPQKDPQVHRGRRGGQRDDVQDHHGQRRQERGDEIPQVPPCPPLHPNI